MACETAVTSISIKASTYTDKHARQSRWSGPKPSIRADPCTQNSFRQLHDIAHLKAKIEDPYLVVWRGTTTSWNYGTARTKKSCKRETRDAVTTINHPSAFSTVNASDHCVDDRRNGNEFVFMSEYARAFRHARAVPSVQKWQLEVGAILFKQSPQALATTKL